MISYNRVSVSAVYVSTLYYLYINNNYNETLSSNIEMMFWYLLTNIYLVSVIANCGASVAENCTYFESAGGESGMHIVKNLF